MPSPEILASSSLKPGGVIIVNDYRIPPVSVSSGGATYPSDEEIRQILQQVSADIHFVPGIHIAEELGNARVSNVVLLGALSKFLEVAEDVWLEALARRVPERFTNVNKQAFVRGRETI